MIASRDDIGAWLVANGLTERAVEIGVYDGANAVAILNSWPGVLHLVDPWAPQERGVYCESPHIDFASVEALAIARLAPFGARAVFHRMLSDDAFEILRGGDPFDFVYVDGNHSGEQVARDIGQWWTLVRPGGVMGGHDFFAAAVGDFGSHCLEIAPLVRSFARHEGIDLHLTTADFPISWFLQKPSTP